MPDQMPPTPRSKVPERQAQGVVAAEVDVGDEPLPPAADGHPRHHRLHAVEHHGDGQQPGDLGHGVAQRGVAGEDDGEAVPEDEYERHEEEADEQRLADHDHDGVPRGPGSAGAELVGDADADGGVEADEDHALPAVDVHADAQRVDGDLCVLEVAREHGDQAQVPDLEAEHDGGLEREPEEGAEVVERGGGPAAPASAVPVDAAPADDVGDLGQRDDPVRGVVGERGAGQAPAEHDDEEVVEERAGEQRAQADPRGHHHPALRLQELAGGEVEGHGEDGGEDVEREAGGLAGHVGVLADEQQQGPGEDEERRHEERGGEEDEPGALEVDAEHGHLPRAVRLAAQRLERAAHAEQEAEREGGEDGEADGGGGQGQVAQVAHEHLGDGADGVGAHHAHRDGEADAPEALRLLPHHDRSVTHGTHQRGVLLLAAAVHRRRRRRRRRRLSVLLLLHLLDGQERKDEEDLQQRARA
ncbi:hypothetical protein U9M48_037770, partial [Paspalum notatum var. saurae]